MAKLCGGRVIRADSTDDKLAAATEYGAGTDAREGDLASARPASHDGPGDTAIDFVASRETLEAR
jgi:hypothetical protein